MNTKLNKTVRIASVIYAMTFALIGSAAEQGAGTSNASGPQHREPPPQAYQDCKGKQVGDVIQITTPHGDKMAATCTTSSKGLFARPEHPPHDQQGSGKNPNN